MVLKFIDREPELASLGRAWAAKGAQFYIVYGRRRIGKTELLLHFARDRPHFYFLAREAALGLELERFRDKLSARFDIRIATGDWEDIFSELAEKMPGRVLVIIDEFSNWIARDRGIVSAFQGVWDNVLKDRDLFLVLLGSYVGLMETEVLGYKSPLYGRRTGQLVVEPMEISVLPDFFPKSTNEELVMTFGCLDTIPFYLGRFEPQAAFWENVASTFLDKANPLFSDAEILLGYELREPDTYLNILRSIQEGSTKLNEIAGHARVDITNIVKYLNRLEKLRIIRKSRPANSPKEGRAIYELGDNYFRFWLSFIYPYREEIGDAPGKHLQFIKSRYPGYMGPVFEEFCRRALRVIKSGQFHQLGRWWFRGEEIDIAGLNEKDGTLFLGECKWSDRVNPSDVLEPLREKAAGVRWRNQDRKERFAIFARSFHKRISEPDVELFDLDNLCGALYQGRKRSQNHN